MSTSGLRIAWVGNDFFRPQVAGLGHQAVHIPLGKAEVLDWAGVCDRAGFEPNLVVYADVSRPPTLLGVEEFPCLTLFYCIDSHLHAWYPFWAQAFDFVAVSLKGHVWRFKARLPEERLLWLPPAPKDWHQPPQGPDAEAGQEWDLLFAGNVDRSTSPKRWAFLKELGERVPGLVIRQGAFEELFPKARLVLNIAEKGDLNFRVFEALACRACLLTPWVRHGLDDLFTNGQHLFVYDSNKMDDLVKLVQGLLASPARRQRVAEAGWRLIEEKHRALHRAQALLDLVGSVSPGKVVAQRLAMAHTIRELFLRDIYLKYAEAYKETPLGATYGEAAKA